MGFSYVKMVDDSIKVNTGIFNAHQCIDDSGLILDEITVTTPYKNCIRFLLFGG